MQKKYRSIDFPLYGIGKGWGFFQLLMASTLDGVSTEVVVPRASSFLVVNLLRGGGRKEIAL